MKLLGLGFLTLLATLSVVAQVKEPTVPLVGQERIDKAHENLLDPLTNQQAIDAGRLTEAFARSQVERESGPVPRKNFIDNNIFDRIERDGIPHAPLASDAVFIRRAYMDATGMLPTPEAVRTYVVDKDPQKQDKLIDSLIGSEPFVERWSWFWLSMLRASGNDVAYWTKMWLRQDRPYNQVFADLVSAGGLKASSMSPVWQLLNHSIQEHFYDTTQMSQDHYEIYNRLDAIDELTTGLGSVFLGINMECVSCHNGKGHADRVNLFLGGLSREQFHQQAAFLGTLTVIPGAVGTDNAIINDDAAGYNTGDDAPFLTVARARFPRSGKAFEPAFILSGEKPRPGMNPRQELGRIMSSHIQFSRAAVNLIWSKLMVVGFVTPYDGFDLARLDPNAKLPDGWTVQPTNTSLLEAMANDFKDNNYSIHHLFKTIMKSSAYQLSTRFPGEWKDSYYPYYARRFVRVLEGPEVADAVAQATGVPYEFKVGEEKRGRVFQMASGSASGAESDAIQALMEAFDYKGRSSLPNFEVSTSITQAMEMMTSEVIGKRLRPASDGVVQKLIKAGKTDDQIIEEVFLSTFARLPSAGEVEVARRILSGGDRQQRAGDLQWALMNTAEFLLNR